MRLFNTTLFLMTATTLLVACGEPGDSPSEEEVITRVTLTFQPMGTGAPVVANYDDPDGDGGAAPTADPIGLFAGTPYTLSVGFQNGLEDPPEEITDEVRDEGDEHQVFFLGSSGLTITPTDTDANGLPIGLTSSVSVDGAGGELVVVLRHLPPVNGNPVKVAGLAEQAQREGVASLPGATDAEVTFTVSVAAE